MLWRRILRSGAVAPLWVTTSPLAETEWEEPYLQTLLATGATFYGVQSGALPPGLTLVGDTITGIPGPSPDAPVWATASGSLGSATQGAAFSSDLDATGAVLFSIKSGLVPWGLLLDTSTGVIAGDLAVIGGAEDSPGPAPTWTTAAGSLGTLNESAVTSLSVAASGAASYAVEAGGLPWGLLLDTATGAITGTTAEVGGGVTPEPPNTITWSAPVSSDLGTYAVSASVSIAQTVTPTGPAFQVVSGAMPWGLSMSRGTGLISGTVGAANAAGVYTFTVAATIALDGSIGSRTYTITIT